MERNDKIQQIMQFIMDHPESQASVAVGRRTIGAGENLRDSQKLSQLSQVLTEVNDEELEACYFIVS